MSNEHLKDDERLERGEPIPTTGAVVRLVPEPTDRLRRLDSAISEAFELMRRRASGEEKPITTPWPDFNLQMDGGFWPGCHVLVSGTGAGKSTWALQLALHTARQQGTHVVYVTLELDEPQIVLRLAGELAGVPWSRLYKGTASPDEISLVVAEREQLAALPLYIETGDALGWPASRMERVAANIRLSYPSGPLLFVVDFLQLIGPELDGPRQDLRERIGRAAYAARDIARRYGATVLLISSVARDKYESVASYDALKAAGLAAEEARGMLIEHFMFTPDAIVGMGKESGEIEYAADSVTVAVTLPREQRERGRPVVFATAKLRTGRPSWCVLEFTGARFDSTHDHGRHVLEKMKREPNARGKPSKAPTAKMPYEPPPDVD